jgi:hypothetical protein
VGPGGSVLVRFATTCRDAVFAAISMRMAWRTHGGDPLGGRHELLAERTRLAMFGVARGGDRASIYAA